MVRVGRRVFHVELLHENGIVENNNLKRSRYAKIARIVRG